MEDSWKNTISGGESMCRPLYGKVTENYSWAFCAKFWEFNLMFPRIHADPAVWKTLEPYTRRILVVFLTSMFTSDHSKVDLDNKVFPDDTDLMDFLKSPEARLAYTKHLFLPFIRRHSYEDAVRILKFPSDRMKRNSLKVVQQMANGGMEPYQGPFDRDSPSAESVEKDVGDAGAPVEVENDLINILRIAHNGSRGAFAVKTEVNKIKDLPGAWTEKVKQKKSKWSNFVEAVAAYPFLFDKAIGTKCARLQIQLPRFEEVLQEIGHGCFGGSFEAWGSVFRMKEELKARGFHSPDEDYDAVGPDGYGSDEICGQLVERINLAELIKEYETMPQGSSKAVVVSLINRHRSEGEQDGDFSEIIVHYVRKHGIPGRRYAVGPSVQKICRSARKAAFTVEASPSADDQCVFVDVDIGNAVPTLHWNEMCEIMGVIDATAELMPLPVLLQHVGPWRQFCQQYCEVDEDTAKTMILKLFSLGLPDTDFPFLWQLAVAIARSADILLGQPRFEYLKRLFSDRRNPTASRMHYALSAKEDHILNDLELQLHSTVPGARIVVYMYDGAVIQMAGDKMSALRECLAAVSHRFNIKYKVAAFPQNV